MKIGLALGGGGAKGAYQVGVLQALEELKLIDSLNIISGVSIGALNGYFYLGSKNSQSVYDAWKQGMDYNVFKEERFFPIDKDTGGFFNLEIIKKLAENYVDEEVFKKAKQDLYIVLTKVARPSLVSLAKKSNREKVIIHLNKKEEPLDYVIASSSIPLIFGFQNIEDEYFVDGGLSDNNPISVLVEKGAKVVFYASLDKHVDLDVFLDKDVTLIELTSIYALPVLAISRLISTVDFDNDSFLKRVKYGYHVTKSMIKYLIEIDVLSLKEEKYSFNVINGFRHITIPDYIHNEVKEMNKEKK